MAKWPRWPMQPGPPGPPPPPIFLFPIATWKNTWAGPNFKTRTAQKFPPVYLIRIFPVKCSKNQRTSNVNNSSYTNPKRVKQIALVQKFNYLSNATGPRFLGFLYDL
jgi:hypothetical protein